MHTAEAPGPIEYLYLTEDSALCGELTAPEDINQPVWNMEYTEIAAFNIDAEGKGTVQASAQRYDDGGEQSTEHWYQYQTANNGKDWTNARLTEKPTATPLGIWERAETGDPDPVLLRKLLSQ